MLLVIFSNVYFFSYNNTSLRHILTKHFQCSSKFYSSPLIDAVRVQLYNIASSPKALPAPIRPSTLLSFITSNSPSADTYKCAPVENTFF